MNNIHQQIQQDLPEYVFGDVDAETRTQIEHYVAECAACRTVADEYAEVMRVLPYGLAPARPTPQLRARVLHEARRRLQLRQVARWMRPWRAGRHRGIVAWAPAVVLLLVLVGWAVRSTATEVAHLAGSPIAPRAVAHLVVPQQGCAPSCPLRVCPHYPQISSTNFGSFSPTRCGSVGGCSA